MRLTPLARLAIRAWSRAIVARRLELEVEGLEHIPPSGPALIACRHFHHLYDGCALLASAPRPLVPLVALDWVRGPCGRRLMEWACAAARWPVVLRADGLIGAGAGAYRAEEARRYLRRGVADAIALLHAGHLLAIFPEGYPNIDPGFTPRRPGETSLPFRPGFARIAELAERGGHERVPIVPAGMAYERGARWRVALRFGAPLLRADWLDRATLVRAVEKRVHDLSAPAGVSCS